MSLSIHSNYTFSFAPPQIDEEEKEIMARLRMYGEVPTGNKTTDRSKLRRIEERKAKENNCVTGRFLTVSKQEEEKIQQTKKEKIAEIDPEKLPENKKQMRAAQKRQGAQLLGEQVYLTIRMKK